MAYIKVNGGGSALRRTTLLTISGSEHIGTLSDSYSNYKYIGVKYQYVAGAETLTSEAIMSTEDFAKTLETGSILKFNALLFGGSSNAYFYARAMWDAGSNRVAWSEHAFRLQDGTTTNPAYIDEFTPLEVFGLK